MIEGWTDPADRLLARSVFGTDDLGTARGMILDWVAGQGFGRARVSAVEISVGAVATVVPVGRPRIVVKVWPGTADARSLAAQVGVQAAMAARGFPAPAVLTRLSAKSRTVVGHRDWSAKNMRTGPGGIAVLYDWDAVPLDREAFVAGSAAAHFPVTWELDVPETPSVREVVAFVREYEEARGAPFIPSELAEVAAAATYARAYKARCEHAIDLGGARWRGSSRESLERDGPFRFDRA